MQASRDPWIGQRYPPLQKMTGLHQGFGLFQTYQRFDPGATIWAFGQVQSRPAKTQQELQGQLWAKNVNIGRDLGGRPGRAAWGKLWREGSCQGSVQAG